MFFFKFIFVIILIYYLVKTIGKIFLPLLFNKAAEKINGQQNFKQKKKGDVTVFYQDKKDKTKDTKFGEYVDYEEIKD